MRSEIDLQINYPQYYEETGRNGLERAEGKMVDYWRLPANTGKQFFKKYLWSWFVQPIMLLIKNVAWLSS
jgi:hypothetical protein